MVTEGDRRLREGASPSTRAFVEGLEHLPLDGVLRGSFEPAEVQGLFMMVASATVIIALALTLPKDRWPY